MRLLQVKKYNEIEGEKYNEAVREFHEGKRLCPTPYQYGFWNLKTHTLRVRGWVALDENRATLKATKKEAFQEILKRKREEIKFLRDIDTDLSLVRQRELKNQIKNIEGVLHDQKTLH